MSKPSVREFERGGAPIGFSEGEIDGEVVGDDAFEAMQVEILKLLINSLCEDKLINESLSTTVGPSVFPIS